MAFGNPLIPHPHPDCAHASLAVPQVLTAIKNKLRFKPGVLYSLAGDAVTWEQALALGTVLVARLVMCTMASPHRFHE